MKVFRVTGIAFALIIVAAAFATAAHVEVRSSSFNLEGVSTAGSEVAPTQAVLDFLSSYGIALNQGAEGLGKAIGMLANTLMDNPANDDRDYIFGDDLNALVNRELMAASHDTDGPIFMDLGTIRWVRQATTE